LIFETKMFSKDLEGALCSYLLVWANSILTIADIISNSSKSSDQNNAFNDLRQQVQNVANGPSSARFSSKEWLVILETLFDFAEKQKTAFNKGSKTAKSTAQNMLSASARALRAVLDVATNSLSLKAAKFVIENICLILTTETGIFDVLSSDYIRCLRIVLEHQPHVEHLRATWTEVLAFCVKTLDHYQEPFLDQNSPQLASTGRSSVRSTFVGSVSGSMRPQPRIEVDELVSCVRQLCRAPNVPILDHAKTTVAPLLQYFNLTASFGRSHYEAMSAINLITARTITSDVALTVWITKQVLPCIVSMWSMKSLQLRYEMLSFLVLTRVHVAREISTGEDQDFTNSIESLIETFRADYSHRRGRDQIHLEDLALTMSSHLDQDIPGGFAMGLQPGNADAEAHWTIVWFIAFCSIMIDRRNRLASVEVSPSHQRAKRARVSTHLDDLLHWSSSSTNAEQTSNLQILSFAVVVGPISTDHLSRIIALALDCSSGSNPTISSWALILLVK